MRVHACVCGGLVFLTHMHQAGIYPWAPPRPADNAIVGIRMWGRTLWFILFSSFPLLLAFVVGGLGFEFYVFVAGWRHALRSEWPFHHIIIIVQVSRSR